VPSDPRSLDVGIDDERLWLLGLVAVLVGASVLGALWSGLASPTAEIEVAMRAEAPVESVDVDVRRAGDDGFETVESGAVSSTQRLVYRTDQPGRYRVAVTLPDRTCSYRVSVSRTDDGRFARSHHDDDRSETRGEAVSVVATAGTGAP
jgi:hypothetical protein